MNNNWDFDQDNMNNNNSMNMDDRSFEIQPKMQPARKVKLEITTQLEAISTGLMILSIIATIILLVVAHDDHNQLINVTTVSALAVSIMLIIVRMNIDEYYVLDTGKQSLMLRSKIFSRENYSIFAHFKTIDAVVANGKYNSGGKNRPGYWTYRAEIVLRTGKVFPIDDWKREGLSAANSKASNFSRLANIECVQGEPHACATPIRLGNKFTFRVKVRTFMDGLKEAWPILILMVVMFGIPAIIAFFDK